MPPSTPFTTASSMIRRRLLQSTRTRGAASSGPSRWTSRAMRKPPRAFSSTAPLLPPGQSRKWEDWELPCYVTSFLTIVILGVGLNAKPDLTIETWAHEKALERLKMESSLAASTATTTTSTNNNNNGNSGDNGDNGEDESTES